MKTHFDAADVNRAIESLGQRVEALFPQNQPLNIIGIRTRGEVLAERLAKWLGGRGRAGIGRGVLDITLYRDDLSEIGPRPLIKPTHIDVKLDGTPLLLVDDVLFTGRSVRAALDALSDFGRPAAIRLAVLVDRGGQELPIRADLVGLQLPEVPADHRVNVRLKETDGVDEIEIGPRN